MSGCRFTWKRRLSSRLRVRRTGRPVRRASSAACPWTFRSSFAPNAPPLDTRVARTFSTGSPSSPATCRRSLQMPWPWLKKWTPPSSVGYASDASGSRNACSMRCVVYVSVMTCAASANAASTSPRLTVETDSTLPGACACSCGRVRCERGHRVGERREDLVLDLDEGRGRAGRGAVLGGDERQHVTDVPGGLAHRDQLGPVGDDLALVALAGDVGGGQHGHHARVRQRPRGVDPQDPRARVVGEPDGAVQHPGHRQVVDVRLVAERELAALVARGAAADASAAIHGRERAAGAHAGRQQHRVDDLDVAGAPAEVAGERRGHLLARRRGVLPQQGLGLHQDPGGAVAALRRAGCHEALRPHLALLRVEALLGDDLAALEAGGRLRAGDDGLAVHQHGAGAARALGGAAVLG